MHRHPVLLRGRRNFTAASPNRDTCSSWARAPEITLQTVPTGWLCCSPTVPRKDRLDVRISEQVCASWAPTAQKHPKLSVTPLHKLSSHSWSCRDCLLGVASRPQCFPGSSLLAQMGTASGLSTKLSLEGHNCKNTPKPSVRTLHTQRGAAKQQALLLPSPLLDQENFRSPKHECLAR